MSHTSSHPVVALGVLLSTLALSAQDRAGYREFQLGSTVASVSALAHVAAADVKTLHQQPALLQEIEWRPAFFVHGAAVASNDPVRQIVFSFHDDQLFRMMVDYDPDRTAGMTAADMIEGISTVYGTALPPAAKAARGAALPPDQESDASVARWGDAGYLVVLYRSPYTSGFRIVVTSPRLDALARTAQAQAALLDRRAAPQRESARQKQEADALRASQEKALLANKAVFKP